MLLWKFNSVDVKSGCLCSVFKTNQADSSLGVCVTERHILAMTLGSWSKQHFCSYILGRLILPIVSRSETIKQYGRRTHYDNGLVWKKARTAIAMMLSQGLVEILIRLSTHSPFLGSLRISHVGMYHKAPCGSDGLIWIVQEGMQISSAALYCPSLGWWYGLPIRNSRA